VRKKLVIPTVVEEKVVSPRGEGKDHFSHTPTRKEGHKSDRPEKKNHKIFTLTTSRGKDYLPATEREKKRLAGFF